MQRRPPRVDLMDMDPANSREHSVHSDLALEIQSPRMSRGPPMAAMAPSLLDEDTLAQVIDRIERKRAKGSGYADIGRKRISDWVLQFWIMGSLAVVIIMVFILYHQISPSLNNVDELTGMLVAHKPEIEQALVTVLTALNFTSIDAVKQYVSIVGDANAGMQQIKALLNDPGTQANIEALTAGIKDGNYAQIGQYVGIGIKIVNAITQSAGNNGVTLSVGNWKAYVNESDLTLK